MCSRPPSATPSILVGPRCRALTLGFRGVVKAAKFMMEGLVMTQTEIMVLVVGIISAFIMSVVAIRFLMGYIKKNDFTAFGVYRIIVGIIVVAFFTMQGTGFIMQ